MNADLILKNKKEFFPSDGSIYYSNLKVHSEKILTYSKG